MSHVVNVLVVSSTRFTIHGITNVIMNYYRNSDKNHIRYDFAVNGELQPELLNEMKRHGSEVFQLPLRSKKPLSYVLALKKIIARGNYDIVHAHGNSATLFLETTAAKTCGVPVRIAHCHNITCNYKLMHYLLKPFLLRSITHAFACSHKAGQWLYGNNYRVINNGIELDKYAFNRKIREDYRRNLGLSDKKVIGHIGNFVYQKNHDFLLDVFYEVSKRDDNYVLLLLGDGILRKHVEEKTQLMGLEKKVIFMGKTDEVPQLLQVMDLVVFPSHFEGLPLALIEAQSSGLKCLVSDVVSTEVQATDLIEFIPLQLGAKYWAERVINTPTCNREAMKDLCLSMLRKKGFDIKTNARVLTEFYLGAAKFNSKA